VRDGSPPGRAGREHRVTRTKIVATVGPSSSSAETLRGLMDAGVDVLRLNFSHGTLDDHARALAAIREAAAATGAAVAVMGDLCGPKIRLGVVEGGTLDLLAGTSVRFVRGDGPCTAAVLTCNYPRLLDEVRPGDRMLIDDGAIDLRAVEFSGDSLVCRVQVPGRISSRKGINLPDTPLSAPSLTAKDLADAAWALRNGVDYLALSFVRTAADVAALRAVIAAANADTHIIAKIETARAMESLDEIIDAADVVLVARGDLGVELPLERVPLVQKDLVRRCQYAGKPVIVATQMLQSMVDSAVPTRAEVSDAANAVFDGADALMLSAETAVGRHPLEAVRVLRRVAAQTEAALSRFVAPVNNELLAASVRQTSAVARGAAVLADDLRVRVVVVWCESGQTARLLSKCRPQQTIAGICRHDRTARRVALYFGVRPIRIAASTPQQQVLSEIDSALVAAGLAEPGERYLVVARGPLSPDGSSSALLLRTLGGGPE